jgi:3-hydroxy-3-methylglutaryl CoA synthase
MTPLGAILQYGVHIPRLRLSHATIAAALAWASPAGRIETRGSRSICNWDEDALSLAVEAARDCLPLSGNVDQPLTVCFCSTTAPFLDRDVAVMLAAALDLPESIETLNLGTSMRAGTGGLINALRRAHTSYTLLAASDARLTRAGSPQELTYGDGAVALKIGPPGPAALATALAARSVSTDFVGHYRMNGAQFDYALEERWVRDESLLKLIPRAVSELLTETGTAAENIQYFVVPSSTATAKRLAQACGLQSASRPERVLRGCGDVGTALPLLMFAEVLESAQSGQMIVLLGVGQGVDAVLLRVEDGVLNSAHPLGRRLANSRDETSYVRYLSHRGLLDVDFGMRAERDQRTAHTVAYRKGAALNSFIGGRCDLCGSVQFPRSRVCVNPECRATDTQTPHRLANSRGRVKSFTEDWQAYAARPPYIYGNVEFSEGGNLLMEFTDTEPGELKVNDETRFVYRIKDNDRVRGFRRYFWKATKA